MKAKVLTSSFVMGIALANNSFAIAGDSLKTLDYGVSRFLMSPTASVMYASVPSLNSVISIDTNDFSVRSSTFVGSGPTNMAITPDGNTLYVANSLSNFIGVLNTSTGSFSNIAISDTPKDIEVGADGRLYVLGSNSIMQINPADGSSAGNDLENIWIYSGELALSADKTTLYYGTYGVSPSTLMQFDVTGDEPVLTWQNEFGTIGSNGNDLAVSNDGSFVSYATGSGQLGYKIAKFRTSDMLMEGTFNTGAYPHEITFSPDDAVAYTVNRIGSIESWDTTTFLQLDSFSVTGESTELAVDSTGRYLFAAMNTGKLEIIDTGRMVSSVPEPSQAVLMILGLGVAGGVARRMKNKTS